jgi:hypothetical protein
LIVQPPKPFDHKFFDFKELETKYVNGKRHYHVDGEYYPSVTTVLSGESKPALEAWKKRVGEEQANRISTAAKNRGTGMHELLEAYVLNKDMTEPMRIAMPSHTELFFQIKPLLDKHVGKIYAIEAPLYSKTLGVAGRADFIADWKGMPAILDFNSSTNRKKPEYMKGYYMQEALYSFMMNEMFDFFIPRIVTLVAHECDNQAEVFEERAANWLKPAIGLVEQFYEAAAKNPTEMIK